MRLVFLMLVAAMAGAAIALLLRRWLPRQLASRARAARLAAAGELSAAIAHEIAQPLAAILSNAEAAEQLIDSGCTPAQLREILAAIREDDERAAAVIQRVRDLVRSAPVEMRTLDLEDLVRRTLALVEGHARARGVQLRASFDAARPFVRGDEVQLQQLLLNLVMNGIDAAAAAPRDRAVIVESLQMPGDRMEIRVRDSGCGIEPQVMPHIFERFFSTKARGLGLGLSISRSIASAHGGTLRAESTPGGTVFRLELPSSREPLPLQPPPCRSHPPCRLS